MTHRTPLSRRALLAATLAAPAAALLPLPGPARAQAAFPSRPIKFVVPFGPGSGTDTSARYFGRKLSEMTGQPVVVENRPGGNGFIAVRQVLAAPADGYTVFIGSNSTLAVNVALFRKLPYDPTRDLAPLSMMMHAPALLVVPPDSPHKDVASLVAAAKAAPLTLNYGAGSAGYQLMAELFNDAAGIQTTHVPFKSAAEALTAVASGMVHFSFADITAALEMVKGCRRRLNFDPPGVRRISWTGYAMSPRLLRYSTGLRAPSEILIRFSLYQRMYASRAWVNCSMLAAFQSRG